MEAFYQPKAKFQITEMASLIRQMAELGKKKKKYSNNKEAVKAERELTKNRNHLIAAARNGDEEAMESLTMEDMEVVLPPLVEEAKEAVVSMGDDTPMAVLSNNATCARTMLLKAARTSSITTSVPCGAPSAPPPSPSSSQAAFPTRAGPLSTA